MKPKYKNVTFKSEKDFEKWLKETTKYHIVFEDKGQDFLEWFVAENGEIIHSDLQSFFWNGKMLKISSIKVGKNPIFLDNKELNYKIIKIN